MTQNLNRNGVGIIGTGGYVPEKVLTNKDLEKMVDTTDDWIISRTGIKERRILDKDKSTSYMAIEAGKKAIEDAGLKSEDIDLIIVSTVTPDMAFPATACLVQNGLGCINASPRLSLIKFNPITIDEFFFLLIAIAGSSSFVMISSALTT